MISFQVDDMTCGHCVGSITKALKAVDPAATVNIDLARHLVQVEPAAAQPGALAEAIRVAGYTPMPAGPAAAPTASASGRGCCG